MNAEQFYREIGMVDDDLIAEANTAEIQKVRKGNPRTRVRRELIAACLALSLTAGMTAYAASPGFREMLADILHIKADGTTYIGLSSSSSGIIMTVESAHVTKDTAVVLLTFQKNDGKTFGNGMNPNITLTDAHEENIFKSGLNGGAYTKLSEDSKTLFCYYTWIFPDSFTDRTVVLKVNELICNQSQVDGVIFRDDLIQGDWSVKFTLTNNKDNTKTIYNTDLTKCLSVFDQELQIDSVLISDMLLVISTTTLSQRDITEEELHHRILSNVFPGSSAYYDVYVQLVYKDGTTSEPVSFCRDDNDDLVAWFPDTIPIGDVADIRIGDISIPTVYSASNPKT